MEIFTAQQQEDIKDEVRRSRAGTEVVEEEQLLRLPKMADTSMDNVGQPLRDVMDRLNGALDQDESWEHIEEEDKSAKQDGKHKVEQPSQQPFLEDSAGKPPDPAPGDPHSPLVTSPYLQTSAEPPEKAGLTPDSPDSAASCSGHHDAEEHGQSQTLPGGHEDEGEAETEEGQEPDMKEAENNEEVEPTAQNEVPAEQQEKLSPSEMSHPAEFK